MNWLQTIEESISEYVETIVVSLSILVIYWIIKKILFKIIGKRASKKDVAPERELYLQKLVKVMLVLIVLTLIGAIWEISYKGLSVYFASIFTIIGVGLFATWSILSNMTASLVLFFFFPYRVGQEVRIVDGENSVEGRIIDITLFYIKIESPDGKLYSYPNNLAIQRPIRIS